jgi:NADPH:quinone reductase-like Zn-dependent oxidoreductase
MSIPKTMHGVYLTGHGGPEMLEYSKDIPVPSPAPDQVLIRVGAAGINNTDINTRIGWYSKTVTGSTDTGTDTGFTDLDEDSSWNGAPFQFPRIQGADVCGHVVSMGSDVAGHTIGDRVLVRTMQSAPDTTEPYIAWTFGSECDGGFAQYATARASETYTVKSDWSDAELASIPCAYSTAEGMLHRANLGAERVLITGASGGVGSAAIQLAKRRGAYVIAVSSASKADEVRGIGADEVIDRNADLVAELGLNSVDVVVDLVAGAQWPSFLEVIRPSGRYAVAGAIAGPIVELDVRTLYLKDLSLLGCTFQEPVVFKNLISYIEANEIRPLVAKTYPLSEINAAQTDFVAKKHTGKLVLIPEA